MTALVTAPALAARARRACLRWKAGAAGLGIMLLTIAPANSTERSAAGSAICAEREVLLQTLIEAHGRFPHAATAIVAEAGIAITQARAACDDGRIGDALALYDPLIAELAAVVTHRGE